VSPQDPNDFTITAEFTADTIAGTPAVNQYSGSYTLGDDGSFSVGTPISTKMAGPGADMQSESTYLQLLAVARSCKVDGDTLTFSNEGGNVSLIYAAQ
jgi:heat shock protein HslJ